MAEWKQDTVRTIAQVAAWNHALFSADYHITTTWDPPALYHQVFLVDADDSISMSGYDFEEISIITPFVLRLITEGIDRHGGRKVWEELDSIFNGVSLHDSGRSIWDLHVMDAVIGGETRQAKMHCITRPPNANRRVLESAELILPLPPAILYDDLESWPQELSKPHASLALFQPRVRSEGAFDSILLAPNQDYIAFFETTISRYVEDSFAGIRRRLVTLVDALEAANMKERLPSESCKWRLVFVVPKHDLTPWLYARNWRAKLPESSWKEHLDMYVFSPEAEAGELEELRWYNS
ncbi:hypothetical protein BOTBODRAFT_480788 [Botryobasidium botryosum FD-172 SS1]|uniref:Uncharacterized protein n=1 Tax=Botryobasidium botryosum (strain FD-172 SS1) TaxID=930990 RepID=A0A067MWA7_BOTB1|nr:hypothetical protein BOTBODRAFT_480788 [Botryobasidium botryosum FD-172 SS1]